MSLVKYVLTWEINTSNPTEVREMNLLHDTLVQAVREQGQALGCLAALNASRPAQKDNITKKTVDNPANL